MASSVNGTVTIAITNDVSTPKNIQVKQDIYKGTTLVGTTYRNVRLLSTFNPWRNVTLRTMEAGGWITGRTMYGNLLNGTVNKNSLVWVRGTVAGARCEFRRPTSDLLATARTYIYKNPGSLIPFGITLEISRIITDFPSLQWNTATSIKTTANGISIFTPVAVNQTNVVIDLTSHTGFVNGHNEVTLEVQLGVGQGLAINTITLPLPAEYNFVYATAVTYCTGLIDTSHTLPDGRYFLTSGGQTGTYIALQNGLGKAVFLVPKSSKNFGPLVFLGAAAVTIRNDAGVSTTEHLDPNGAPASRVTSIASNNRVTEYSNRYSFVGIKAGGTAGVVQGFIQYIDNL